MYETSCQSRFNARYWMLGASALGWPRGMVWGGRREEGSGWVHMYTCGGFIMIFGITNTILQNFKNKIKFKKKKNRVIGSFSKLPSCVWGVGTQCVWFFLNFTTFLFCSFLSTKRIILFFRRGSPFDPFNTHHKIFSNSFYLMYIILCTLSSCTEKLSHFSCDQLKLP